MYAGYVQPPQPALRQPVPPPRQPPGLPQPLEQLRPSWGSAESVDKFVKIEQIGEGTYGEARCCNTASSPMFAHKKRAVLFSPAGCCRAELCCSSASQYVCYFIFRVAAERAALRPQVFMARNSKSGETVALKRVKVQKDTDREGFPITAIREIKILKSLKHPNIVSLKEIVVSKVLLSSDPALPAPARRALVLERPLGLAAARHWRACTPGRPYSFSRSLRRPSLALDCALPTRPSKVAGGFPSLAQLSPLAELPAHSSPARMALPRSRALRISSAGASIWCSSTSTMISQASQAGALL